jgi:hypothetical protein
MLPMPAFRMAGRRVGIDLLSCETPSLDRAFMLARHLAYQPADPRSLVEVSECLGAKAQLDIKHHLAEIQPYG